MGSIGEILEGSENEVGKRTLQIHASDEKPGGVPIKGYPDGELEEGGWIQRPGHSNCA